MNMERERRIKGTPTRQLHSPVAVDTHRKLKAVAKRKGVSIGLLLDEMVLALPLESEPRGGNGTAILRSSSALS